MHVAICVERPLPDAGGAEAASFGLIRHLRARGHRVSLLCREAQPGSDEPGYIAVPGPGWGKGTRVLAYARGCAQRLRTLGADVSLATGKELGTDVVWPHGGVHRASLHASLAGRPLWARVKWLSPKQRAFLALERKIYSQPGLRRVVAVSERVAADLRTHFGLDRRVQVIENGVDLTRFHADPEARVRLRRQWQLEGCWGLHVAHQKRLKGLDLLLAALQRLPELRLLVVGRGSRRPFRRALARLGERVRWLGPRADMPDLYRVADLFCHPTRYDPCPLVSLEALASGLPVVTSVQDGLSPKLGAAGRVLPALSVEALTRALQHSLDPDWREAAGRAARGLAEQSFGLARCFDRLEGLLATLAAEKR